MVKGGGGGGGSGGATTAKKRKGRPSRSELQRRAIEKEQLQNQQKSQQRSSSTRRNPNSTAAAISGDHSANGDEFSDDEDDERKEKKVKLVVRLPQSSDLIRSSSSVNSASSGSDSNANVDNCKINSGSGNVIADDDYIQGEKTLKATDNVHGSPMESGPTTTPLPDKKLLVFILERLQKKDTYGVFSEPVDPDELPDYHELIEHPMDFGTVRRKLDEGLYSNLDELEADVFLICSNGMQYNSSDTIYFRQARTIQELAKRDFANLRHEGDDGEPQPKVVKRGRPPSKHLKRPPVNLAGPESTSGATLASVEDNTTTEPNPYSLRRGPMLYRHQADGFLGSHRNREAERHSESLSDWNEEFPARIRRADMKYGNKHVIIDETRRDTYKQYLSSIFADDQFLLSNFRGERKRLMAVGLHLVDHGYAKSLARFTANLGPVVRKVASKKIEKALPLKRSEIPSTTGSNPDIEAEQNCLDDRSFGSQKWFSYCF